MSEKKTSPLRVLLAEDDATLRAELQEFLSWTHPRTFSAADGLEAWEQIRNQKADLLVTDIKMPHMDGLALAQRVKSQFPHLPVIITTAFSEIPILIKAIEIGIDRFIPKPVNGDHLLEVIAQLGKPLLDRQELNRLQDQMRGGLGALFGFSPAMKRLLEDLVKAAPTDFSILLEGETGSGKSMLARAIHQLSERVEKPFVTVDIASIPESLVERELFGHVKGAFTGADTTRQGFLECAHGGTLFLDELENLNPETQKKLLSVIEERKLFPLGSTRAVTVDFRLVGASNRPLLDLVHEGLFRSDLYYRLNDLTLKVPPLRERPEDIPYLARSFLDDASEELGCPPVPPLDEPLADWLTRQTWPGNVRELKNLMRRCVLMARNRRLSLEDFHAHQSLPSDRNPLPPSAAGLPTLNLEELEGMALEEAMSRSDQNKAQAARLLGIDYSTLKRRCRKRFPES